MLQHADRARVSHASARDTAGSGKHPQSRAHAGPADASSEADCGETTLAEVLRPMLEAVVRLAGASAATVRTIGGDGAVGVPVAAVGGPIPAGTAPWCAVCDEPVDQESECVQRHVCGSADQLLAPSVTQVCRHVTSVPLEHRGRPVGSLNLLFRAPTRLAPDMAPLLKAVGDLLGVTLDNARLAAENLRMTLMSERQMMANEVHDSIAQALTYMRMRMSLLSDAIRQGDELRAFKYWTDVDGSLTGAHRRLRELITYFRSRMDPQGLVHALEETADAFHERTGIELSFRNQVAGLCLPAEREIEIFHIVQEALANVCRHARARHVEVGIARAGDGYEIEVVDDGVGVSAFPDDDDSEEGGHYGVQIMRERARRLGGTLAVEGAPGRGTRIRLYVPAVQPRNENRS